MGKVGGDDLAAYGVAGEAFFDHGGEERGGKGSEIEACPGGLELGLKGF